MTQEIKLCKDCKHYGGRRYCNYPSMENVDVVSGNTLRVYCTTMRLFHKPCGPEARLFETKPTFFQKIKNIFKGKV